MKTLDRKAEERIRQYEQMLDCAEKTAGLMETALEAYAGIQADLQKLEAYYTGPEWKADYAADEAGAFAKSLKRGVLSQDGIDHILERYEEISARMRMLSGGKEE